LKIFGYIYFNVDYS